MDSPKRKIYINSLGVATGGGLRLLESLFSQTNIQDSYHFFLDERVQTSPDCQPNVSWEKISYSKKARLKLEKRLSKTIQPGDTLLCFNNLPPMYPNVGETIVFLQNRNVIKPLFMSEASFKENINLVLNWLLFKKNSKRVDRFFVQTPTMMSLLGRKNVELVPFLPKMPQTGELLKIPENKNETEFFYPAAPYYYKNHDRLISAWSLLKKKGYMPRLKLTTSLKKLSKKSQSIISKESLSIIFLEELNYEEIFQQYFSSHALIFPSLCESFGLPLLEAQHLGLPILASNRDFVRDVANTHLLFDPLSPQNIAETVKTFFKAPKTTLNKKLIDSENLFEKI